MGYPKSFLVCLLCTIPFIGFSQTKCTQKVSLLSVKNVVNEGAVVELEVVSKGAFRGKVIQSTTSSEEVIKEFVGTGTERVFISDLNKDLFYRVILEFDGEPNFLCKSKVLPDIFSTDKP